MERKERLVRSVAGKAAASNASRAQQSLSTSATGHESRIHHFARYEPSRQPVQSSQTPTSRFKPKVIDNTDPARFRPKAIRDSAALIWSQGEFPLPPSPNSLSNVTRVDLSGSPCVDISWLKDTKVTWLNLKSCQIKQGWDAVGSLKDLTGQ